MNKGVDNTGSAQSLRSPHRRVVVLVVLLVLATMAALTWKAFEDHQKERALVISALQLQNQALVSVFESAFESSEQTLLNLDEQVQARGQFDAQVNLRDRLLRSPFLQDLRFYDDKGTVLARAALTPLKNTRLPDWVASQQAQGRLTGTGRWRDEFGSYRSVRLHNGRLLGTFVVTFAKTFFLGLAEQIPGADIEAALLLGPDNLVLLDLDNRVNTSELDALLQAEPPLGTNTQMKRTGFYEVGGKLVGIQQLRNQPIRLIQVVSKQLAFERWTVQLIQSGVMAAAIALVTLIFLRQWLRAVNQSDAATKAMHKLQHEQQQLIKSIPVGVYRYRICASGKDQFDYVSERLCGDLGLQAADILRDARLAFNSYQPKDVARLIKATTEALATDGHLVFEGQLKGDTTHPRWLRLESVLTWQDNGDQVWDGVQSDITEQVLNQKEIANQRRSLANIIDGTHIGTWEWNVQSGATEFNQRWAEIAGYTLDELAPVSIDTWINLTHPDDLKVSGELLQKHFAGELPYYGCEVRMRHKNGHWVWVHDRGRVASWTSDGKPLLMSGTHQDISARKEAEAQLQHARLLLHSAIETIGEAFVIYDAEDRLAFCNAQYRTLYKVSAPVLEQGRTFEEIIRFGVAHGQYKAAIGKEEAWVAERLAAHRQAKQTLIQELDDGRWLKVTERLTPTGHIVGFRVDVTEFYQAKKEAEAANLAKSRFLATMSHEIRTPMNGILGMAQLLLMPNLQEDQRNDYARTILSSGQTLLTLLNDILDLSKIEAGKFQLETTSFSPEALMHETANLFSGAAQVKGLPLDCQWRGASGQRYMADSHRLRQMLSNLVDNALKFTHQGHVHIEATELEHSSDTSVLEFAVSDTGIGIPGDKMHLLFRPFSQADNSITREFGGSGLGLSIVRHLAIAMDGEAGVSSEPGVGSRFWFRAKVRHITEAQNSRQSEHPAQDTPANTKTLLHGHVLVAEDNLVNCSVIESLLIQLGLGVTIVHDGQQVVQVLQATGLMAPSADTALRDAPDLILMDLQMPVMDGYSATEKIRQWETDKQRPRLPIVALTADAFAEDRQHCLTVGMDDFLTKPVVLEALKSALAKWLPNNPKMPALPAVPVPFKPVDVAALGALLSELTPLLESNKFAAISRFHALRALLAGTHLSQDVEILYVPLQNMRFNEVLAGLRRINPNHVTYTTEKL